MPPHNLDAERETLGCCLVYPELVREVKVNTGTFYSSANREVWSAISWLEGEGHPINDDAVIQRLRDTNKLAQVGGEDYVLSLTDGIMTKEPPAHLLRLLHARRTLGSHAKRIHSAANDGDLGDAAAAIHAAQDTLERATIAPRRDKLVDWARRMRPIERRLTTGFPTLDRAMRGGVPIGSIVMLNGAPGTGKTALGVVLADRWEREGCSVMYYAGDQRGEGIVVRFGQLAGYSRAALEEAGPANDRVRLDFAKRCEDRELEVYDPFDRTPAGTLDDAARQLILSAGARPPVLVVDSLQMARCADAEAADTVRGRIDAVIATLVRVARQGVTVVALSEVSRVAYRTGSRQSDASGLSSGKESSAIEYQGDALVVLRSVKDEPDLIDVETAKNSRFGAGNPDLRLRLDRERHTFTETERPPDEEGKSSAKHIRSVHLRSAILDVVRKHRPTSANDIHDIMGGTRPDVLTEIRALKAEGILVQPEGPKTAIRVAPPLGGRPHV